MVSNPSPSKVQKRSRQIQDDFKQLGISPEEYPEYSHPISFGEHFTICTLLKPSVIISGEHSVLQEDTHA